MSLSMVNYGREFASTASISLVYTPEQLRKNGYASIAVAELTKLLLDSGKTEINLFTDISNPTSNKIYQDIGYEFIGDSIHYQVCS